MGMFKNQKVKEIIWLSRGGQGAKTSALLFGEAALASGFFIQVFPEYGPERSGAPMKVYTRISNQFIRFRTPIEAPSIIVVLDSSLLKNQPNDILKNKKINFLINSPQSPTSLKKYFKIKGSILTLDASAISKKFLNKSIPSIAMLGALIGFFDFNWSVVESNFKNRLAEKLGKDLVEPNIKIIKESYKIIKNKQKKL